METRQEKEDRIRSTLPNMSFEQLGKQAEQEILRREVNEHQQQLKGKKVFIKYKKDITPDEETELSKDVIQKFYSIHPSGHIHISGFDSGILVCFDFEIEKQAMEVYKGFQGKG